MPYLSSYATPNPVIFKQPFAKLRQISIVRTISSKILLVRCKRPALVLLVAGVLFFAVLGYNAANTTARSTPTIALELLPNALQTSESYNSTTPPITPTTAPKASCKPDDVKCTACQVQTRQCQTKFDTEIAKQLRINLLPHHTPHAANTETVAHAKAAAANSATDAETAKNLCKPSLVVLPCNSPDVANSNSSFRCTRDIVIEQFDYHTQSACLEAIAADAAKASGSHIPRIGHSYFFYKKPNASSASAFKFHDHLSVLSMIRHLRARVFFFWNDGLPTGRWWIEMLQRVTHPNFAELLGIDAGAGAGAGAGVGNQPAKHNYPFRFYSVYRDQLPDIYGTKFSKFAAYHASDVGRIESLVRYGGMYLDFDAFAVQNVDPLITSGADWIMGYEIDWCCLNNGVLFGAPNSAFGKLWHCEYAHGYNPEDFTHHSVWRPHTLSERCPHLIRRESSSLNKPNNYGYSRNLLYGQNVEFDLRGNYVVHGWLSQYNEQAQLSPESIKSMNFTLARIWRHIYYAISLHDAHHSSPPSVFDAALQRLKGYF